MAVGKARGARASVAKRVQNVVRHSTPAFICIGKGMHLHPGWELLPIQSAHAQFACWERAKHRAEFFAILGFPDTHPLRLALDQVCIGLEEHRWAAEATVTDVATKHGDVFHKTVIIAWGAMTVDTGDTYTFA